MKWHGFSSAENTWEPVSTMAEDVPDMVRLYHDKLKAGKAKTAVARALGM